MPKKPEPKKTGPPPRSAPPPPAEPPASSGEETVVEAVDLGTLEALTRAEIDTQVATAKRYPRSMTNFKRNALAWMTVDAETARRCFYSLKRRDKDGSIVWITGETIRAAEIAAAAFGNMRYGKRVIGTDERWVEAQGVARDMENNNEAGISVRRRITGRDGRRYSEDMIQTTGAAAASIALRNAVFTVIPRAILAPVFAQVREVALGKGLTMAQRWDRLVAEFAKHGAKPADLLQVLGISGPSDLTLDHVVKLQGLRTAIEDGETTMEEQLRSGGAVVDERAAGPLTPERVADPESVRGEDDAKAKAEVARAVAGETAALRAQAETLLKSGKLSPVAQAAAEKFLQETAALGSEPKATTEGGKPAATDSDPGSEDELDRMAKLFDN